MTTAYPTGLDAFDPPQAGQTLASPKPAYEYVRDLQDAIEAIEAAVGIIDSAVTDSVQYRVDNHAHPAQDIELEHTMLSTTGHSDSQGGTPVDGRVVMYAVDEDTGSEGWTARDLPPALGDHALLSGLTNEADHPQYALAGHAHLAEEVLDNSVFLTMTLGSAGTGSDRALFVAPWACRLKSFSIVLTQGTTPSATVMPKQNGSTDLLSAGLAAAAADTAYTSTSVEDVELAAGDYVLCDVTAASGTPNIFMQLEVERI